MYKPRLQLNAKGFPTIVKENQRIIIVKFLNQCQILFRAQYRLKQGCMCEKKSYRIKTQTDLSKGRKVILNNFTDNRKNSVIGQNESK